MPAGKTHDKINLAFLLVFLIGMTSIGFFSLKFALVFSFGYLFGTFFLGPDLDTRSSVSKRWGVFRFIWRPYRRIFPHRSIFTHGPIIGDIIRLLYLGVWVLLLFVLPCYLVDTYVQENLKKWVPIQSELWIGLGMLLLVLYVLNNLTNRCFSKKIHVKYKNNKTGFWVTLIILTGISFNAVDKFSIFNLVKEFNENNLYVIWFIPIGVGLSSLVHIISDIFASSTKMMFK